MHRKSKSDKGAFVLKIQSVVAKECVCLLWPCASGQEEGMISEGQQAAVILKHCLNRSLLRTLAIEKGQKRQFIQFAKVRYIYS